MKKNFPVDKILNRSELSLLIAGQSGCQSGSMSCDSFASLTGCYPSDNPGDSCLGSDGCTYNTMTSTGSCAGGGGGGC